jgi:hypothetical protein
MNPYGWFFGLLFAAFTIHPSFACHRGSAVILDENFKNPESGWGVAENILSYGPSGATLKFPPETALPSMNQHYTSDGTNLCMTVVWPPAAASEHTVGIIFWAKDTTNYYTAQFTNHGAIFVNRRIADTAQFLLLENDDKHPDLIHKQPGGTNEVELQISGLKAIMWVNGKKIFDFAGQPPSGSGYVGFFGSRTATADVSGDPPIITIPRFMISTYP